MTSQAKSDPRRLSREERIEIATKILGSKCNRASVKTAVAVVRYVEERQKRRPYQYRTKPINKREKKAIDRLAKALHRFEYGT